MANAYGFPDAALKEMARTREIINPPKRYKDSWAPPAPLPANALPSQSVLSPMIPMAAPATKGPGLLAAHQPVKAFQPPDLSPMIDGKKIDANYWKGLLDRQRTFTAPNGAVGSYFLAPGEKSPQDDLYSEQVASAQRHRALQEAPLDLAGALGVVGGSRGPSTPEQALVQMAMARNLLADQANRQKLGRADALAPFKQDAYAADAKKNIAAADTSEAMNRLYAAAMDPEHPQNELAVALLGRITPSQRREQLTEEEYGKMVRSAYGLADSSMMNAALLDAAGYREGKKFKLLREAIPEKKNWYGGVEVEEQKALYGRD